MQADEAKSKYWAVHGEPENISGRNGGAHLGYLEALLTGSAAGFAVGDKVSIAGDLLCPKCIVCHSLPFQRTPILAVALDTVLHPVFVTS